MKKIFNLLGRSALLLGLLVALTPCGLCHSASLQAVQQGHGCCAGASSQDAHSDRGPLCQIMDQSSLSVEMVHLDMPGVVPTVQGGHPVVLVADVVPFLSVTVFSSPPRSPQILRI